MTGGEPVFRLTLPDGWIETAEVAEGQHVRVFHPPAPLSGILRLLTDRIAVDAPGDTAAVAIKLREVAVRFVRPDDSRAGDRLIEDDPSGGIAASAVMTTQNDDGVAETHYLWMRAEPIPGKPAIRAAMAALALPREHDGTEDGGQVVAVADAMLRAAAFTES